MPEAEGMCDFCASPNPRWAFPARDFSQSVSVDARPQFGIPGEVIMHAGSLGSWAACPVCHALILRGDRDRLARRSARMMVKKHPIITMTQAMDMVRQAHDAFWSHREGQPVPTTPGAPDPFQEGGDHAQH